jgi:hypothetical protein
MFRPEWPPSGAQVFVVRTLLLSVIRVSFLLLLCGLHVVAFGFLVVSALSVLAGWGVLCACRPSCLKSPSIVRHILQKSNHMQPEEITLGGTTTASQ